MRASEWEHDGRIQQVGEYRIPEGGDPKAGTYVLIDIPAPPNARWSMRSDFYTRTVTASLELMVACSQCLKPLNFEWQHSVSHQELERAARPEALALFAATQMHDKLVASESRARAIFLAKTEAERELNSLRKFVAEQITGRYRPSRERLRKAWKKRGGR